MEEPRRPAESGLGPLHGPRARTSHLAVPAAPAQEAKEMKRTATLQPQALHGCPHVLASSREHRYVAFLFLTLILKGCSDCLNVLVTASLGQSHGAASRVPSGPGVTPTPRGALCPTEHTW